jgi:hypothetical protein
MSLGVRRSYFDQMLTYDQRKVIVPVQDLLSSTALYRLNMAMNSYIYIMRTTRDLSLLTPAEFPKERLLRPAVAKLISDREMINKTNVDRVLKGVDKRVLTASQPNAKLIEDRSA